jgi:hypothetical protein
VNRRERRVRGKLKLVGERISASWELDVRLRRMVLSSSVCQGERSDAVLHRNIMRPQG